MKRLFKETTKAKVLQGQYWDEFLYQSLLTKYRMNMDDYDDQQTVEWIVLFLKTHGALDATKLLNGVIDKQTGAINQALFEYIPWYLGYRGDDFDRIISVPYNPDIYMAPLNMIEAQFKLEVERYESKGYHKKYRNFCSSNEKKEEKPKDDLDEYFKDLFVIGQKTYEEPGPSRYIEYGIPQYYVPLSSQLVLPFLNINEVVRKALKDSKYDNPIHPEYVRYCGLYSVTEIMLTTLFVMYIIREYFKKPRKSNRIKIYTESNTQMVYNEITAAIKFENDISTFWRERSRDSKYYSWEYENYNTIKHTEEILERSKVVLKPVYEDFKNDENFDLGHFPGASLF